MDGPFSLTVNSNISLFEVKKCIWKQCMTVFFLLLISFSFLSEKVESILSHSFHISYCHMEIILLKQCYSTCFSCIQSKYQFPVLCIFSNRTGKDPNYELYSFCYSQKAWQVFFSETLYTLLGLSLFFFFLNKGDREE